MLGGWDYSRPEFSQPLNKGPIYERINYQWVEKCPMERNFKAHDIIFIESVNGNKYSRHRLLSPLWASHFLGL